MSSVDHLTIETPNSSDHPIECTRPLVGGSGLVGVALLTYLGMALTVLVVSVRAIWFGKPLPDYYSPIIYPATLALSAFMVFHAVRLVQAWRRAAWHLRRLQTLGRRVPAHTWRVRRYTRGRSRSPRYRLRVVFRAPNERWYDVESDEFRGNPESRIFTPPQVLLDPEDPRQSVLDMSSIPSPLGILFTLWRNSQNRD